jgi:hypothetical protein
MRKTSRVKNYTPIHSDFTFVVASGVEGTCFSPISSSKCISAHNVKNAQARSPSGTWF